ncbi:MULTISPECIES: hypothetical protein [Amycolatopsis]|uniref:hypothetical protein n=1 Tax=Amycolatopsis TaxID=1813 RepID=UPI001178B45E|nr:MULTISPECIES: hypothetical protein [Amycolatopsis]
MPCSPSRPRTCGTPLTELTPGACLTIPLGTTFQFRAGPDGLEVVAATAPPWPGTPDEATPTTGHC